MGAKRGRDPLMIEVLVELGSGRISEDFIRAEGKGYVVDGLIDCGSGHIAINPVHMVVDVVIHECVHRARPAWSERTVRARTARLLRVLTSKEQETIFDIYQRVAKKVKRRGRRSA